MLLDIKCLALILYSTIPRWMRKLPSLCVREAKCLGLESKPAHGLTELGNTEQKEMNELLPFPVLVKWSCRFQGIILCSLCSELSWNPCSYKHLILVLGGKKPHTVKRCTISASFLHNSVVVRALILEKGMFSELSSAWRNPTYTFHHSEEHNPSCWLWWIASNNVCEFIVSEKTPSKHTLGVNEEGSSPESRLQLRVSPKSRWAAY